MEAPTISHPTDKANFTHVAVAGVDFYFSYRTCVAFRGSNGRMVVRENEWGPTTGKHLNWIDEDKSTRVDGATFQRMLAALEIHYGEDVTA